MHNCRDIYRRNRKIHINSYKNFLTKPRYKVNDRGEWKDCPPKTNKIEKCIYTKTLQIIMDKTLQPLCYYILLKKSLLIQDSHGSTFVSTF